MSEITAQTVSLPSGSGRKPRPQASLPAPAYLRSPDPLLKLEDLIPLSEAAKRVSKLTGKRPNVSVLWRWARNGVLGVRLQVWRVGRHLMTTDAALLEFFEARACLETNQLAKEKARKNREPRERKLNPEIKVRPNSREILREKFGFK